MKVTVTSAAAAGTYSIKVDDSLTNAGSDCSGACVKPTYTLSVKFPVPVTPVGDSVGPIYLYPSSGSLVAGTPGTIQYIAVIATISGDQSAEAYLDYEVSPPVSGIWAWWNPSWNSGSPPSGWFELFINTEASVPPGVYTVSVGEWLEPGESCAPTSPCAGVFTLTVTGTVDAALSDSLNVADSSPPSPSAPLSDTLRITGLQVAPATALLSDGIHIADTYVSPAIAALSEGVNLIDTYVAPARAALQDLVSVTDHLTASPVTTAAVFGVGMGGLGLVAGLVVRETKGRGKAKSKKASS
jgi:hypothetical protein